jgi:hypothetical protein
LQSSDQELRDDIPPFVRTDQILIFYERKEMPHTVGCNHHFVRSAHVAAANLSVSFDINERDARGSRDYLARTITGAPEGKVRVRLDGSSEELDVNPSDVRLPK